MKINKVLVSFIALSLGYIFLTLVMPVEATAFQSKYQLSDSQISLLRLTVAAPIVVIWLLAYYGYAKFRAYANSIKESREAKPLSRLVDGLLVLGLWLPLTSVINNIATRIYTDNPGLTEEMTITRNYIGLIILLGAFMLIHQGSRDLAKVTKKSAATNMRPTLMTILAVVSTIFAYVTLTNPVRQFPNESTPIAAYYLPDFLLFFTIIVPYVLVFYFGLLAVQNLIFYRQNVKGIIYKNALGWLAGGICVAVICVIVLRYLSGVTTVFSDASLKIVLSIIYLLVILIAAGYVLIAWGAKKLQKIEEV